MSRLPGTIRHPLVGDEVTFIKTGEETEGEYCIVKVVLQPGGDTGLHYHTRFEESFEVLQGHLGLQDQQEIIQLAPGEKYTIGKNRRHRFFNSSKGPVTFLCTITPAGSFEQLLRIAYGLAADGKVTKKGIPKNIWHLALMFQIGESYLPGMPLWLQKKLFGALAAIARWRKADKALLKYYRSL
jgi:mannose-6-phosphate isomerase-like protein (cupin superfamily)